MSVKNILATFMLLGFIANASARDDVGDYNVKDALSTSKAKEVLGDEIQFYFGDQKHGKVLENYGEFHTNKKTNAFGKSDQKACHWVFLSAMKSLRDRAITEGGNAVVNIKSNYKNNETISNKKFKCGAGAVMAGVALKGTVVKLAK